MPQIRILKDVNNNTIDISSENLSNFNTTVISPISTKLTRVLYNGSTDTTSLSGTTVEVTATNFNVTGHTGTVLFTGDVESSLSNPSSTKPLQTKVIISNFVQKTRTIAGINLANNISAQSLTNAIISNVEEGLFDIESKTSDVDWDSD